MAVAIVNKVLDFLGVETGGQEDFDEENELDTLEVESEEETEERGFFKRNKVVSMPQVQPVKMVTGWKQKRDVL